MALARLVLNRLVMVFLGVYAIGLLTQSSCHGESAWLRSLDVLGSLRTLSQAMH